MLGGAPKIELSEFPLPKDASVGVKYLITLDSGEEGKT